MYSVHPSRGIGPPQPPCQTHIYFNCLQMSRITSAKLAFLFAAVGRKCPASAKYSVRKTLSRIFLHWEQLNSETRVLVLLGSPLTNFCFRVKLHSHGALFVRERSRSLARNRLFSDQCSVLVPFGNRHWGSDSAAEAPPARKANSSRIWCLLCRKVLR